MEKIFTEETEKELAKAGVTYELQKGGTLIKFNKPLMIPLNWIVEGIEIKTIPRDEILSVANSMIKYAGSFVESLGKALLQADEFNQQKIKNAFPEYWEKYKNWGK